MPQPELYENKILQDAEMPIQINTNIWSTRGTVWKVGAPNNYPTGFYSHWHEHIELHYIVQGEADFRLNQSTCHVMPGDFVIINSNELHSAICTQEPYYARVIIFDIKDLSPELSGFNYLFQSFVSEDRHVADLTERILREYQEERCAYKQVCKALVTELLVHMCRNYVSQSLSERDSLRRKKDLERLNVVLSYIQAHYSESITNSQLADMICLSEDRFGHLFREGVGKPPLQYINDMRLKSALNLLKTSDHTVTQVAEAVGFRDYNHFGRLFRKRYGCTPYEVKSGKYSSVEDNSK